MIKTSFIKYCTKYWFAHVSRAEKLGVPPIYLIQYSKTRPGLLRHWVRLCPSYYEHTPGKGVIQRCSNLICIATYFNLMSVVQSLLRSEPDPNLKDSSENSMVSVVDRSEHQTAGSQPVSWISEALSRETIQDAFTIAVFAQRGSLVRLFLEYGADVNQKVPTLYVVQRLVSNHYSNYRMITLLLGESLKGLLSKPATLTNGDLLHVVCSYSKASREVVQALVDHGVEVNKIGGYYGTALQAATANGNKRIVALLLKNGAEINTVIEGYQYETALQGAVVNADRNLIKRLLKHGADVNIVAGTRGTALHTATIMGRIEVVNLLLKYGAKVDMIGGPYGTALQAAAVLCEHKIAWLLLYNGAKVNVESEPYGTALRAAVWMENVEVARLLLQHGADPNLCGHDSIGNVLDPPLHRAIKRGCKEDMIKLLISHGAASEGIGPVPGHLPSQVEYKSRWCLMM